MKLSLAGWSLNRRFRDYAHPFPLLSFPAAARDEFGIDAIELNNVFFASREDSYLETLLRKAERAGVSMVGMVADGTGDLASCDEAERLAAVEEASLWLVVSAKLGLPWVCVNAGGRGHEERPEALEACIRSFSDLARAAGDLGLHILIENQWGLSSHPERTLAILTGVGAPNLHALADFGNFPASVDRYAALERLAPHTQMVHAKSCQFDAAGNETKIDFARCIKILKRAKYKGYVGIEYVGEEDDHEGVLKTKALLERLLAPRAKGPRQ